MKVEPTMETTAAELGNVDYSGKDASQTALNGDGHVPRYQTGSGSGEHNEVTSSDGVDIEFDENESEMGNPLESETVERVDCSSTADATDCDGESPSSGDSRRSETDASPDTETRLSPNSSDSDLPINRTSPKLGDSTGKLKTTSPSLSDGLILVPTTDHPLANLEFSSSLDNSTEVDEPMKKANRRVHFHENESKTCVLSYHAAPDPWSNRSTFTSSQLVLAYRHACHQNGLKAIGKLISQLEATADVGERYETLTLKGERLDRRHCDALEEIFRRVQFKTVDLEATDLDDDSAGSVFDMLEFYDSATRLVIAYNKGIGPRGWQACSRMLRRTPSLTHLDLRSCCISDHSMPFLGRALRVGSLLQVLHLENSGISAKVLLILVAALKLNDNLRELYLADNRLMPSDGIQLGNLLKHNDRIQLLDLRNNHLQDTGTTHICDGLEVHDQRGWGLTTLVLWNNQITQHSMNKMAHALAANRTLETLNLGHNNLGNEGMLLLKEGLLKNQSLKRLGLQCCRLYCEGAIAVAELIADSQRLLRVDLRENEIKTAGLMALSLSLKMNQTVTRLDLDKEPKKERAVKDYLEQQVGLMSDISNWLQRNREHAYCIEQVQKTDTSERKTESAESPDHGKDSPDSVQNEVDERTESPVDEEMDVSVEESAESPEELEKTERFELDQVLPPRPKAKLDLIFDNRSSSLESPMVGSDVSLTVSDHVGPLITDHVGEYSPRSRKRGGGRMFSVKYVPENSLHEAGLSMMSPSDAIVSPTLEFPLSLNPGETGQRPVLVPVDACPALLVPVDENDSESETGFDENESETRFDEIESGTGFDENESDSNISVRLTLESPSKSPMEVQLNEKQSETTNYENDEVRSDSSQNVIVQSDTESLSS